MSVYASAWLVIGMALSAPQDARPQGSPASKSEERPTMEGMKEAGHAAAKRYVPDHLKAPGTAKFPFDVVQVEPVPNEPMQPMRRYAVKGRVDAKNPLGGEVSADWTALMIFDRGQYHPLGIVMKSRVSGETMVVYTTNLDFRHLHPIVEPARDAESVMAGSSESMLFYDLPSIKKVVALEGDARDKMVATLAKKKKIVTVPGGTRIRCLNVHEKYLDVLVLEGRYKDRHAYILRESFERQP